MRATRPPTPHRVHLPPLRGKVTTMSEPLDFETLVIHAAQGPDPATGAVVPPIVLSTTFAQATPGQPGDYEYSRSGNPTRAVLEGCVAELEAGPGAGAAGLAFASGSAASMTILQTLAPGDHLVACDDVYGGTYRMMDAVLRPLGIEVSRVDMADLDALRASVREETRMFWVETPTNPLLKLIDIAAVSAIAADAGVRLVVDNTFATPALQRPLLLGADTVVHSSTKYLNGHADVVGGLVVTTDDTFAERLRFLQNAVGAVPSPFDCYLVLRGIKTLPLRVRRQSETALSLATALQGHPAVVAVRYPGLASHPQHALAATQMAAGGGMVSIELSGGLAAARAMLERLRLFVCAESLGGVESLAEHPASMTHAAIPAETRAQLGIHDGLVRLSVGLEAERDLWRDLQAALPL